MHKKPATFEQRAFQSCNSLDYSIIPETPDELGEAVTDDSRSRFVNAGF
ncbi:hypothetical protein [Mesorhizobium sp. ISC11]